MEPDKVDNFIDPLAKALLKENDNYVKLAEFAIRQYDPKAEIRSWKLVDKEIKNFHDDDNSIMDLLAEIKTSSGIFIVDIEVQSYPTSVLELRMQKYERALVSDTSLKLAAKQQKESRTYPVFIQIWMFKQGESRRFQGRKFSVIDYMDIRTHRRYSLGSMFVLFNGEYFTKRKGKFIPETESDAILYFFSLSDIEEIEKYAEECNFQSPYNMLARLRKFFRYKKNWDAYMKRELEILDLQVKEKKLKKAEAQTKAEREARLKAEAQTRAESERADKAEAQTKAESERADKAEAQARTEREARLKAEAEIEKLKADLAAKS